MAYGLDRNIRGLAGNIPDGQDGIGKPNEITTTLFLYNYLVVMIG